ncbi:bifunctional 2-C-methyl-D-erythritol 4-phosphate cytidylyltransferase/2-C-methyl-D-erythritol 2,4-cyclodiphosphate synthase [Kordiimonas lacus]|uniref:Bifunctional enzyme IspD/IspF n=1 Tax=Kordiimonas lacus TaxID=637679 RepID=A0A1G6WG17_9PROT|nr:bifunctional 2-C-methyl-D-erythritol 4-phosphate cytidylyltransferase/2-C-methyl-D-erythritol 2,4-cyclodiphosphate synthase [Kordiimonas lacus]SDD64900.1 2-C-methyl-D-erythritol 2,4-cyclodiphosphate synthase [Kordiimonas lacus]
MTQVSIVIVAAGRGSRAGEGLPKQYRKLGGKMVLTRTIESFLAIDPTANIICVIHPDDMALYKAATEGLELQEQVLGGETRQDSVRNGLSGIEHLNPDYVLVHDAARPFVTEEVYRGVMEALESGADGVVPAVPVTDTLKFVENDTIKQTVSREHLYAVQTPQGFPFQPLIAAHEATIGQELTDDAAVVEAAGGTIVISAGNSRNVKLTTPDDFKKAEQQIMMALGDIRTGGGYDVHRFEDGDHVWLCGVKLPFTKSLKGHSDADVGLHALTDAILAALCDGDIGTHFPPSDNQWRGAPSDVFLTFARDRVLARGGQIGHVGVCLICEKPKIGPHKDAMRDRVAELLEIPASRVSVQATTTEKLGFTGREEGIAAQATATVRLPLGDT